MQPLADTSNLERPDRGSKRQRLGQLQEAATFQLLVERAGIRGLREAGDDCQQLSAPAVDDPRQTKRQLAADLATPAAQDTFLSGLADALADEALLHRCLLPISVTVQVSYATGDSFMRLLLNMLPLQQQVATMLLHKLPEFSQNDCEDGAAAGGRTVSSVPNLILGQLRWLEVAADANALTRVVLEVLPVCSPPVQQQLIGFLPEIVQQQDHELVVGQLQGLLEQDLSFMAAVLDCVSNMQLEPHLQEQVMSALLDQLPAVEVEDLPGLIRYLLLAATKTNAEQVLTAVRASLQFVSPADPRLAVADRKQKGPAAHASRSPEVLLVKDLVAALQMNEAAAAAALALEGSLSEPSAHRCFDLLVLLALHAKADGTRKSIEALLRRKLLEGQAHAAWICKSLQGHQASFRELWAPLLSLAELWSRAREAPLAAAAAQLYVNLFVVFESSLERQQVLQALHSHLGSGVAAEQDVALQTLGELARSQCVLLSQYSSYLANVLDHLEGFTDSQLHQVFSMFAVLTVLQPGQQAGGGLSSTAVAAGGGGSRLEDELVITLNKALAQASPAYKRIGVIGSLALLQQAAADYELISNTADNTAASGLLDSWVSRADGIFTQCSAHPGVLAFMMEQWAELLEKPAGGGGHGFAAQVPKPMLEWLLEKVQELLNIFLADMCPAAPSQSEHQEQPPPQPSIPLDDSNLQAQLWLNVDGAYTPLYLQILPLASSRDTNKRAMLVWLPAALQLLAAVSRQTSGGNLAGIDALLGCPLALPDTAIFTDRWDALALPSKVVVLTSLLHAISWLREVVAVFAPAMNTDALLAAGSTQNTMEAMAEAQNKLLMRLSQLRLLEALFTHLASSCPAAAQQLPDLSRPLTCASSSGLSAAGAAAAARLRATAGAAADAGSNAANKEPPAMSAVEALARARCLRVPALQALNVCQPPEMLLTTLLPAAHLGVDLHTKLKLLLNRARRPAGLMAPSAPVTTAGAASAGAAGAGAASKSPPCLQSMTLQQLVEQLVPTLPALQQHLATALSVIRELPESGGDWLFKDLPGSQDAALLGICSLPAVQPGVDAAAAAHSLAMACLQTFSMLLGCTKELPLLQIAKTLAALAGRPDAAATDQQQMHALLIAAFKACKKLSCRASGSSTLQLELAVLSLWQAIASMAVTQQLPAAKQTAVANVLSSAAEGLLQESWQLPDEAQEGSKGFSWKGQSAAVTQLLTVLITQSADPSQKLLTLVTEVLHEVPAKVPGKEQLNPIAGFAALCSATFLTWYKVVFEQLVAHWDKLLQQGMALLTPATVAAGSQAGRAGRGRKAQQPQLNSQGQPDWDEAKVDEVLAAASRCAAAFGPLVALAKVHQTRNGLLGNAVKLGGAFIDGLLKAMPLWQALFYNGRDAQFLALVRDVQKGTKVMQTICNEAKARRAGALLSRAPAAKRSLERFLFEMMAFFNAAGAAEAFKVGTLKHRDLDGNVVGSQICPEEEGEEEEEEEDDEAQDADE